MLGRFRGMFLLGGVAALLLGTVNGESECSYPAYHPVARGVLNGDMRCSQEIWYIAQVFSGPHSNGG